MRPAALKKPFIGCLATLIPLVILSWFSTSPGAPLDLQGLQQAILDTGADWTADETPLSMLSMEEKINRTGALPMTPSDLPTAGPLPEPGARKLPSTLDWRSNGGNYVTPARDQGSCGSCWAHADMGVLESKVLMRTGEAAAHLDLSEQVVVSCGDENACAGGTLGGGAKFLINYGAPPESCYPYVSSNGICSDSCADWPRKSFRASEWYYAAAPAAEDLKAILNSLGPVSVTMTAFEDFFSYKSGIYSHVAGNRVALHAVLLLGYNDFRRYFIGKNSWGAGWGESGFFKVGYDAVGSDLQLGADTVALGEALTPGTSDYLSLLSPNGGEAWKKGSSQNITWRYGGDPGATVKIQLLKGDKLVAMIQSAAAIGEDGTGAYLWKVPVALEAGSKYRIRVLSASQTAIADASNAPFSITRSTTSDAVTLSSPNGGETLTMLEGFQRTIQWRYTGSPGPWLKVELLKGGKRVRTIAASAPVGTNGGGSLSWFVPDTLASGSDYRIRIVSLSDTTVSDSSDADFTIREPPGSFQLISPNGGEVWRRGSTQNLQWRYTLSGSGNLSPTVRLSLYKGGRFHSTIVPQTLNDTEYAWTVPASIMDGKDYRVQVTDSYLPLIYDASDKDFTISGGAPLECLTVTSPNGGESWQVGSIHEITWTTRGTAISNVKIVLWIEDVPYSILETSIPNRNGILWSVPKTLPFGRRFRIAVANAADDTTFDTSDDYFEIHSTSPGASVKLLSPEGGETWKAGTKRDITWAYAGKPGPALRLDLFKGGSPRAVIAPSVKPGSSGFGRFVWSIPSALRDGSDYRLKIASVSDPFVYDETATSFTLNHAPESGRIKVTFPNGGENLVRGLKQTLTWAYKGDIGNRAAIALYKDGFKVSDIVASGPAGASGLGSFPWRVPSSLGDGKGYSVKISGIGAAASIYDFSDGPFTVAAPAPYYQYVLKWGAKGSAAGKFLRPSGIAVAAEGSVYVVDSENDCVQKFDSNGTFITRWGSSGSYDGEFDTPGGIAVDGSGRVYVTDSYNQRVQMFQPNGDFIVEWGSFGGQNGKMDLPTSVAVGPSGDVYLVDSYNQCIQKFKRDGTFVAKWGKQGSTDGRFMSASGIAVDSRERVYVVDEALNRVQQFDSDGRFLAKWGREGSGKGAFLSPTGITVDSQNRIYVTDGENCRVQKFNASGAFITKWGSAETGNGQFIHPASIAVDSQGNAYVADSWRTCIQKFAPPGGK
jgi:C1A family cysteine protease/sugar lactone lactonase YvrE